MCSRPVRYTQLPAGTDLKATLAAERQRMIADGWVADELTRYTFVFCQRGNDRWCITIESFEPGTAPIGHGHLIAYKSQK